MNNIVISDKVKSILIRAIKTFAQTAASMIAVGVGFEDLDWIRIISVSGVAFVLSVLMNIGGTPESTYRGALVFENDQDGDPVLRVKSDTAPLDLIKAGVTSINMKIENNMSE